MHPSIREKPVLAFVAHGLVMAIYLALAAGIGVTAYQLYDYSPVLAGCLGGLFAVGCGLLHLAFTPRTARLDRREAARIDNEFQTVKASQEALLAEVAAFKDAVSEETRAREAALTRELRDLAVLITQFAKSARAAPAPVAPVAKGPPPRSDQSLLAAVKAAIDDNRVELHVQPVVTLPQRRVAFYEGFTRLRDATGAVIMPGEFLRVAEPSGLVAEIDNLLLLRCVQIARRLARQDKRTSIFCNLSPTSLADEGFFPQFIAFLRENRDLSGSIVFEIGRDAFERLSIPAERNMGRLFDLGFRFSIDRCDTIDLDLRKLERMGVRYVKIAGDVLVRQLSRDNARPVSGHSREFEARDVASLFARYGVDLIADRVENEQTVVEILELDLHYAQGNLFGSPRPLAETALEEDASPAQWRRMAS
jgi:cyclic-di-GMP phosphodiesterase, flagellum assembly factor TipF